MGNRIFALKITKVKGDEDQQNMFEAIWESLNLGIYTEYFEPFLIGEYKTYGKALDGLYEYTNNFYDLYDWCDLPYTSFFDIEIVDVTDVNTTMLHVTLVDTDQKEYIIDFPLDGYRPKSGIEYLWFDGNFGCDCNKRIQINRIKGIAMGDNDDHPCGETIEVKKIVVDYERCVD